MTLHSIYCLFRLKISTPEKSPQIKIALKKATTIGNIGRLVSFKVSIQ